MAKLERCLVGGTFERFHQGHKTLLKTALEVAEFVEVWITNDAMSAAKSPFLQSFEDRREEIIAWADERITTHELEDNFENTLLQGLIAHDAVLGSNLGPRSPGSLINLIYRMATHDNSIFGGIYEIDGGSKAFVDTLLDMSNKNKVEIKTSSSVKRCITENDKQ